MVRSQRILTGAVGIGGLLALSLGTGTLHAQAAPGPATKIVVSASPTSIAANQTAAKSTVTATVEDASGATVTSSTAALTFVTSAGSLASPTTEPAAAGVATDQLTASTSTLGGTDMVTVSSPGLTSGSTPVAETGTNSNFVNDAYVTMLGHAADAPALSFWVGRLNIGMPRSTLATALATTPEYRNDVISGATNSVPGLDFYNLYLDRAFDPAGADYWVSRMSGIGGAMLTFEQVRLQFAGSPEYFSSSVVGNNSPATAIQSLYNDLLGRTDGGASDTTGTNYWLGHYNATTIATQFLFSAEGRSYLVNALYNQILVRPADTAGLSHWTNALLAGASDENIIASILGSDEYYNNHH
jgi:hypothetical protein